MVTNKKDPEKIVTGLLEIGNRKHGLLCDAEHNYRTTPADPWISNELMEKYGLREGLVLEVRTKGKRAKNPIVREVLKVNGREPDDFFETREFDDFVVIDPNERIKLETGPTPLGTRVMDLLTPIGKGQRGLIVSPPRTGKTILQQQIANGITTNHPEIHLMMLLIDERPEEVTDIRRNVQGEVVASSNDKGFESHVRIARLALERVKRLVELGKDVVVLLDSVTRLGRAFNAWVGSSGRTMSGGIDIHALQLPKKIFGSARNAEGGGSLTIIATALIDTGSRMDEIIFQEFKGTGNMELVLDRDLANKRIYPAIDIPQSGTRKEELLLDKDKIEKVYRLRRHLDSLPVGQDVDTLVRALKKQPDNDSFLSGLP